MIGPKSLVTERVMTREKMIDKATRRVLAIDGDMRSLFRPHGYRLTMKATVWREFVPEIRIEFRRLVESHGGRIVGSQMAVVARAFDGYTD